MRYKLISCILTLALVIGTVCVPGSPARAASAITVEVMTSVDGVTKTQELSDVSLMDALTSAGIGVTDVTGLKVKAGTVTEADWRTIIYGDNTNYFTQLTVLDCADVTSEDFPEIPGVSSKALFPSSLVTVRFPEGVTRIATSAFRGCENLKEVMLPETLTSIGGYAFQGCMGLTGIDLPDSLRMIEQSAFENCKSISEIVIPSGVTYSGDRSFKNCSMMKRLVLPEGLETIGQESFSGCGITEIALPDSVTGINRGAFQSCSALTKVTLPDRVSNLGGEAFAYCSSLQRVTIPPSVQFIGSATFRNCVSLQELTVPNGITFDRTKYETPADIDFQSIFGYRCNLKNFNIIVNEGEDVDTMVPVQIAQADMFGGVVAEDHALFFYLPDGTPLSDETTPTLDEVAAVYRAAADGDPTDGLWYGWEVGRTVSVENRLTNLETDNESTVWKSTDGDYREVLTPSQGEGGSYRLPDKVQVRIGGSAAGDGTYTYDSSTGELVISKEAITGDIEIIAAGALLPFDLTVKTSGAGTTEVATSLISARTIGASTLELKVMGGDAVRMTFTPDEGCKLLFVTLDGKAVTTEEGKLTIPAVQESHTVEAVFSEKILPTPVPTATPTPIPSESPIPTPDPVVSPTPTDPVESPSPTPVLVASASPTAAPVQPPRETPVPTGSPEPGELSDIEAALGVSQETAAKIQAVAKELDVARDTVLITEKTITEQKTDDDLKGSYFARIQARVTQLTENNIKLRWNRVRGADGYQIYSNRCNTKKWIYEYKLSKTLENGNTKTYIDRKCKKGMYYKYIVRAYKIIDGKKVTIAASKTIHAVTNGGRYGNAKTVRLNKKKVTIRKGKKWRLRAREIKDRKKLRHHRPVSYESSNPAVATVSKTGAVRAKKKGKCTVYAYAQNGIYKKLSVTVK